ncbi:SGNH/GDSL hydrolase family protein [Streptomyces sp. NPDC051554]|uniref:SGNH/GDSL hydrolase family protein n=1 Tax=Streptomyces sp. NPDC051554 TaxID=3365656 RepID=UPI00379A6DFC
MLMSLGLVAVSSGTASATSAYDSVIRPTDSLLISDQNGGSADISLKVRSVLAHCNPGASTSLESAIQNGGYWLALQEGDNAYVRWSADSSTYASFFMQDSTTPAWGTSTGVFSVVRIGGYEGCGDYYPNLNRTYNEPLLTADNGVGILFSTFPTAYPSGYAGDPIPASEPHAKYVAMGDSFSSGEGNPSFEAGSATSTDKCHRSPVAYPRLLNSSLNLGAMAFVACSGAKTSNVLHGGSADGAWGESPQIDALSDDTEVVTITIGGNDVGFKAFATACTIGSCDFATTAYSDIHGKIVNDLPGELADVYAAIDGATSSTADIYVVGYPQIAPAEMPTGPNSACYPFNGGADNSDPELNDGATAYAVVSELNSVIHDAVTDMNSSKFHFVDPNLSGSPFIGHDWCQQDRYFVQIGVPIPPSNTEYSFHPNADGQAAYKTVVEGEMN